MEYLHESRRYLPSGRVDRSWDGASWAKTLYDGAGRAVRTLAHYDAETPNARTRTDGFEDRSLAGWGTGTGWFTVAGASLGADTDFATTGPRTGRGRLRVSTSATLANTGAYWNLAGPTFVAGHTYRLQADVKGWAGYTMRAFLGVDASGADYHEDTDADTAGTQSLATTGGWQTLSIEWTPATTTTGAVHFAVRKDAAGAINVYLDNVRFWDTGTGETDWNIPSTTVYDADGQSIASVLPPGDLRSERELVTATGFDATGRATAISANATLEYSHAISATAALTAYWPLDIVAGAALDEKGSNDLTVAGPVGRGIAGGPDDVRGAYRFNGSSTYLSTSTLPTRAVDNVTLEAWFRYDALPTTDQVIAYNGTVNTGYGLQMQANGKLGVLFSGVGLLDSGVVPAAGPWHFVRFERLAGMEKLFLDGTERSLTNTSLVPITPTTVFSVGRYDNPVSYRYFKGEIDEVALYADGTSVLDHYSIGRQTDPVTALTSRTGYDALGRAVDAWNPAGTRTKAGYDRLGKQTETIANYVDGITTGGTADDDVRSTFAYDVLGELTRYCPAEEVKVGGCTPSDINEAQAWRYEFDKLGRQTKTIPPDNTAVTDLTTEEVVYELGGRIAKTCRYPAGTSCGAFDSRHVDFTYDKRGRILTQRPGIAARAPPPTASSSPRP